MAVILKYVLSIAFFLAGGVKVFRAKPMVDQFQEFGLPNYGVVLVGALEVIGAIAIWVPKLSVLSVIGLFIFMVGAVANHLKVKHPFKAYAPALILGILCSIMVSLQYL